MAAITTFLLGDISRNVPPLRDVNEPMAFTEIYLRYEIAK
jgi:hypothetical protein